MTRTLKNTASKMLFKYLPRPNLFVPAIALLGLSLALTSPLRADDALVPLKLKLPAPVFIGTPKDLPPGTSVEPLSDKPRPLMMVPADLKNVAPQSKITCSDTNATADVLARITDGNKEATEENIVPLRKGVQYVQFDLGSAQEIFAIVIWHAHDTPKIFRAVVVQVADDATFTDNVRTLFNNDQANVSKLGAGANREYFETNEGKLIDAKGVKARCVRLYSKGSTDSALNEYTEVEIYARPPK
jgi:hypothetical protein